MFSAFSFGKIIKTILPGAILAAALLLIAESWWGIFHPAEGLLIAMVPKDWIASFTAALIPVSLILGFFLNTLAWMTLNPRLRNRCTAEIASLGVYGPLRQKLSSVLSEDLRKKFAEPAPALGDIVFTKPPALEYYYLPVVNLTNLNYLWESYFCWYEFDVNSVVALMPFALSAAFLLWVKVGHAPVLCSGLLVLLFAFFLP